eukprot:2003582-Rhodomonas_salina.1
MTRFAHSVSDPLLRNHHMLTATTIPASSSPCPQYLRAQNRTKSQPEWYRSRPRADQIAPKTVHVTHPRLY